MTIQVEGTMRNLGLPEGWCVLFDPEAVRLIEAAHATFALDIPAVEDPYDGQKVLVTVHAREES